MSEGAGKLQSLARFLSSNRADDRGTNAAWKERTIEIEESKQKNVKESKIKSVKKTCRVITF